MLQAAPAPQTDRSGELIAGRYQLLRLLDTGGQAHVYRARDQRDGDTIAIKILKNEFTRDPTWRERMLREARALSLLSGSAAVSILDQVATDDGALCLVMEYLEGADLEDCLRGMQAQGKTMSVPLLGEIVRPIVHTLLVAHDNHILHRDIKPGNIFVLNDGSVRLLDFGFAKFLHLTGTTQTGFVPGSPSYLAPECWQDVPGGLDRRIDVYALAAVMFRALGGRPPFVGDLPTLLKAVTTGSRPSLHALRPDLPPTVDHWVEQALAIDRGQRFDGVDGMWRAFWRTVA
jgi:serine/threonine-protein kinase